MSRELNSAQIWSQAPLANRTASVIRSRQTVNTTVSVANAFTGNKDVTITAVTDTAKCVVILMLAGASDSGVNAGVGSRFSIVAAPTLTSTTNLRWVIAGNSSEGESYFWSSVQIVEFY